MNYAFWQGSDPGVLHEAPLLFRAACAGAFGTRREYPGGSVVSALFTYLSGVPDAAFFQENQDLFANQFLVCQSDAWADFLVKTGKIRTVLCRYLMVPMCAPSQKPLRLLPPGYLLSAFDEAAFLQHPFQHGEHYKDFTDFSQRAVGAVIHRDGQIIAAASSFLTFENHIELDVSTDPAHRHLGLADHCIAALMAQCAQRALTIHWDAQNEASYRMALGHGFSLAQPYAVYLLN